MRKIALTLTILFFTLISWACPFTISMVDSYGDGWNGNTVDIYINSVLVQSGITLGSGSGPEDVIFDAQDGDFVEIVYNASGSYTSEPEYTIYDMNGVFVVDDGIGGVMPTGTSFTATCPQPTCVDGIMNGNETYIDCGGSDCPPCPQCGNGVMDADEEGVDCGGVNCPACVYENNIDDVTGQTISTCNGVLYDSGGSTGDYANSQNYTVTYCSSNGSQLSADVVTNTESSYDYVNIFDGPSTASTQLCNFSGSNTQTFLSTGSCLTVQFTSDGSVTYPGFDITFSCIAPTCDDGLWNGAEEYIDCGGPDCPPCTQCNNGVMDGDEEWIDCGGTTCPPCNDITVDEVDGVTITSCSFLVYDTGGPTGNYGANEDYTFTVCSDGSDDLVLEFTQFSTPNTSDYLIVFDGPNTTSPMIGNYSNTSLQGSVIWATGTCLTIVWHSDGTTVSTGFAAQFTCQTPTCTDGYWNGNEVYTDCGGPDCPPCAQCGNGIMDADEEGVDCGGVNCPPCVTDNNIDQVDGTTVSTCNGTLYDSGGSTGDYANSQNYTVTYCSSDGSQLAANVYYSGEGCCDHLYIHDGPSTASTQLIDIVGSANGTFLSTGTCLTFHWTSDGSVTGEGFIIDFTCIVPTCDDGMWNGQEAYIDCGGPDCNPCPPCGNGIMDGNEEGIDCGGPDCPECPTDWEIDDITGTTTTTCSGTLYDSGGATGDYQNSENFNATFCSPDGCPLLLNVFLDGEGCCDYLSFYDGNSTSATQITSFTGDGATATNINTTVTSSGSCITVQWTSDGSVTYPGFEIDVNCVSNSNPCDPWTLTTSMNCESSQATNVCAGNSTIGDPPCGNYMGDDVWFETTVPGTGMLTISTTGMDLTDMAMAIYTGPSCSSLILEDCVTSGQAGSSMPWYNTSSIPAGTTVWVRMWDEGNDEFGAFGICGIDNMGPPQCDAQSPLAGNTCGTATSICSFNGYCGNTSDAYDAQDVPAGFCGSVENNGWVSFIAAADEVSLNVWTSNCVMGDGIQMEIYQTYDCTNFTSVSNCVSDGIESDFTITTDVPLTVGETYYLMIDGWAGDNCDYVVQAAEGVLVASAICVETGTDEVNLCTGSSAQLLATGGTSYTWSPTTGLDDPFIANPTASPTSDIIYTVSVTGGDPDCPSSSSAEVKVFVVDGYYIAATSTDVTCYGDSNGTAEVLAYDGIEPYTYQWGTITTDSAVANLTPGTYGVTVTDQAGCVLDTTVVIGEPSQINVYLSSTTTITGTSNGTATVDSVINAVGVITYLWDSLTGYQTTQTATGLEETLYCVTVTDENGCTGTACIDVGSIANPEAGFTYNGDQCFENHSFDFTNTGSAPDTTISYSWVFENGTPALSSDVDPSGVTWSVSGTYAVTQTVIQGTVIDDTTIYITIFVQPEITVTGTDPLCFGASDGTATVNHMVGTSPYAYAWSSNANGQTTQTITGLSDDTYYVTVTDTNGCTVISSIKLFEPPELQDSTTTVQAHCDNNDGEAQVYIWGGTQPYSILWSAGVDSTTDHITQIIPGFYDVTVTDDNGCSIMSTVNVGNTANVTADVIATTDISCYGICDGSITVEISANGVADFTYEWSDNTIATSVLSSNTHSGLCAGYFRVTVTDINNCSSADSVSLFEPDQLLSTVSGTNVSCYGGSDGTIDLEVTGGTNPYSYLWAPGNMIVQDPFDLAADTYGVIITDANSCTAISSIVITQPSAPVTLSIIPTDALCYGSADGEADLTVTGGTPPYTYFWTGNYFTQDISGVVAGTYSVTVTDANGCTEIASTIIGEPDPIIHSTATENATCFELADGKATITIVSGGTPGYNFLWSNNIASTGDSSHIASLAADTYFITITDANGCSVTTSVKIYEPDKLQISTSVDKTICQTESTTISASATGGTPGYTMYWDVPATGSSINVHPLESTIYTVYAQDVNGCISEPEITKIIVRPPITANLLVSSDSVCEGEAVILDFEVSGGLPPYYYLVDGDTVEPGHAYYPAITGLIEVVVSDSCVSPEVVDDTLITVHPLPQVSFDSDTNAGCVPLTVQFLEPSLWDGQTWRWDFGDPLSLNYGYLKNESHTYTEAGVYDVSLTIRTKYGCENQYIATEYITVHPKPTAKFDLDPKVVSIIDPVIDFTNLSIGSDYCDWDFGDGNTSGICDTRNIYEDPGEFDIRLIASTTYNCSDTTYYNDLLITDEYTFYVPTAFTPDDDGINDLFSPMIYGLKRGTYSMYIYDRWGGLVFQTPIYDVSKSGEIHHGWDGRIYGKEKIAKPGVYQYIISYTDNGGVSHEESGSVTVIR